MLSNPKERVGISVSDLGIICHFIAGHAQMLHKQIFPQGHLPQGSSYQGAKRNPVTTALSSHCPSHPTSSEVKVVATHRVLLFATGSSVHRILQARILEWVAISFSRGSSQPRD